MISEVTRSNFIQFAAQKLNIVRGDEEAELNWSLRVLYSLIGLNMLSSLYDYDENLDGNMIERSVSIQHVKGRGEELLEAFYDIFHEKADFGESKEIVIKEIIRIYNKTGFILKKNYRFAYPPVIEIAYSGTCIIRGALPWNVQNMSGLAPYVQGIDIEKYTDWQQAFGIMKMTIEDWWQHLLDHCQWEATDQLPIEVEYINCRRKNGEPYWLSQCIKTGITMYRDKLPGNRKYGLLCTEKGKIGLCTLPPWLVKDREYLRIAIALQNQTGHRPIAQFISDSAIVHIRLDYLLPPNEQNFLELISWPDNRLLHWQRVIPACYRCGVKDMLKNLGYIILEG